MHSKRVTIPLLALISGLLAYGITSYGNADTPTVTFYWDHPTTGTPVDHYVGQWEAAGTVGEIPDIPRGDIRGSWTLDYQYGLSHRLRVAGVDSLDRQGPWSEWAEMWNDAGPPGQPTKPGATLTMK